MTVTCWRALAENAHESVRKGQPIMVTGRYYSREYTVNEQPRVAYELEASAVGHDLARGVSTFTKVTRPRAPQVEVDASGLPAEASDEWLDGGDGADDAPSELEVVAVA